jgi:Ca-activated chloride channel homolog
MLIDWYEQVEFANAWVLPLLLALPVAGWIWLRSRARTHGSMTVSAAASFTTKSLRQGFVYLPLVLRLLAIACIIVALARPRIRDVSSRNEGEGIAIVLCMDVSGSMLSQDFHPNRLEVAKQAAADFVKARPVDQIGLVIFAGESFTQFPVTTDHESLLAQINGLKSGMLEDGTLIGEGLATSVQRLSELRTRSRVVVLLTDGKEEAPETRIIDPATALGIARAKGVKVYTIGLGSDNAVTVSEGGRKLDRNTAYIDEALLRQIGTQTGGAYFRARDKASLESVYDRIDRLEKSAIQVVRKTRYADQFHYFILAALTLLLLEAVFRYLILRTFP